MSRLKKAKAEAKRKAYAEKKEEQGRKTVNWIFGGLIALGLLYAIYTILVLG